MIKTNKDKIIKLSVQGEISAPIASAVGKVSSDGTIFNLPGTGGITYNLKIGDYACGFNCDHAEPGVSVKNYDENANNAFNFYSCVGNEATVISGDAKGSKGFVTGTHGGIEHVLMYFDEDTIEKLNIGDKINVKSFGQGLKLLDYPEIMVKNIDPNLLEKLTIEEHDGKIIVNVAKIVPAHLMGSGIGSHTSNRGDYDISMFDSETVEKYNLQDLRLGDIVFLENSDNTFGRDYLTGACTIGVVVHSDCMILGHGPGVTTLMTSKKPIIEPRINKNANLANILL